MIDVHITRQGKLHPAALRSLIALAGCILTTSVKFVHIPSVVLEKMTWVCSWLSSYPSLLSIVVLCGTSREVGTDA